jgi:hypothetical protein
VERAIRYVREGFFAARAFTDLDDLNAQAEAWCNGQAADRPCPEDRAMSVREAFAQERAHLLALPENPFATDEHVAVRVAKTPYVRFERNDYSVPHTYVQRTLSVLASPTEVRVVDGATVIARHLRSYDAGQQIEDPAHLAALTAQKAAARAHRATDRLAQAAPASTELLRAAAARGENLGSLTAALLRLLERYGASELEAAIGEALAHGVPHPHAVRASLERRREQRQLPPPLALPLPEDPRVRELVVRPHSLASYDHLHPDPERPDDPTDPH